MLRFCSRSVAALNDHEKTTAADDLQGVRVDRVVSEHLGKSKPSNGIHAPLVCVYSHGIHAPLDATLKRDRLQFDRVRFDFDR